MTAATVLSPWLLAVAASLASFAVAGLWRRLALRRQWLDLPDARRLHATPTPRGGGVGIALAMLACAPWLGQGGALFALGLAITAGAGLYDDLRPLRAAPKFLLQVAGALPLALAWPLLPALLGPVGAVLAAGLLVLALVNIWNFMDGSNGLAASQALLFGAATAVLAGSGTPAGWLGIAMAAGCLGFLPWNLPRARLFLGDAGSHALGFGVAGAALLASTQGEASPWQLLLLPSAFLVDASLTLSGRLWRRQKFWLAHREHLYQRAVARGWSHGGIAAAYAAWTLLAAALALALAGRAQATQAMVVAGVLAVGILLHAWLGRLWPRPPAAIAMESMDEA